jgi:low density lipoprotein receptor adapter protein 1
LPENWTDTRETLLEGMVFSLKYLGMTLVERPKGEELSAAAVKRIVATVSAQIPRAPPGQLTLPQLSLSLGRICVT